jgi:hypothetical protein
LLSWLRGNANRIVGGDDESGNRKPASMARSISTSAVRKFKICVAPATFKVPFFLSFDLFLNYLLIMSRPQRNVAPKSYAEWSDDDESASPQRAAQAPAKKARKTQEDADQE